MTSALRSIRRIDMGQVEGAFIQGMGWLTTEELVYDAEGRLTTHAPATYKIPVASDTPPIFNTRLFTRAQSDAEHLPLEGRRRAAADARNFRLFRDPRRGASNQSERTAEARSAVHAGIDPQCDRFAERGGLRGGAMRAFRRLMDAIEAEGSAALVTLARVEGSSPREAGARMVVRPSGGFHGTIGGGALEWAALDAAQAALKEGRGPRLAPLAGARARAWRNAAADGSNGAIETFDTRDLDDLSPFGDRRGRRRSDAQGAPRAATAGSSGRSSTSWRSEAPTARLPADEGWIEPLGDSARAVYLFGAGHVGRALALALAPLPFAVRWIDSRRDAFPAHAPANVALIHAPEPAAELADAPDGALIVVMTHSHALDLEIVAAALAPERFGYVGLIGSATKRARFLSQMRAAGLTEVRARPPRLPDRPPGVKAKDPAVIAASTAAQLLIVERTSLAAFRLRILVKAIILAGKRNRSTSGMGSRCFLCRHRCAGRRLEFRHVAVAQGPGGPRIVSWRNCPQAIDIAYFGRRNRRKSERSNQNGEGKDEVWDSSKSAQPSSDAQDRGRGPRLESRASCEDTVQRPRPR